MNADRSARILLLAPLWTLVAASGCTTSGTLGDLPISGSMSGGGTGDASAEGGDGDAGGTDQADGDGDDADGAGSSGEPPEVVDCSLFPVDWGADNDVVIPSGADSCVEGTVEARSVTIEEGGRLWASRTVDSQLTVHGNIIVEGHLDYGSADDRISARAEIVLANLDDYAVHGMADQSDGEYILSYVEFLPSDIGLWVRGEGRFDAAGQMKKSWSFVTDGASGEDKTIEVEDATGWEVGDTVVLSPSMRRDEIPPSEGRTGLLFSEMTIESVEGNVVTLSGDLVGTHDGCTDCYRRSEAVNTTRNVVVRAQDEQDKGHVTILDTGAAVLDSIELKWLGPAAFEYENGQQGACTGSLGVRPALFFGDLGSGGAESSVRHVSIHASENSMLAITNTDGIEFFDIAGYDTFGRGFDSWGRNDDTILEQVFIGGVWYVDTNGLAAGCGAYRGLGLSVPHGIGSGFRGCAVAGVSGRGIGQDFRFGEYLEDTVVHHAGEYGVKWRAAHDCSEHVLRNNQIWSNELGAWVGDYGTSNLLENWLITDNGTSALAIESVSQRGDDRPDFVNMTIDRVFIGAYTISVGNPHELIDATWTGEYPVGIAQIEEVCSFGPAEEDNFDSFECSPSWLQVENPTFPANVKPFEFGYQINRRAFWEIRGFSHPDTATYGDLPANFNLYRPDNPVTAASVGGTSAYMHDDSACGSPGCGFDAWIVELPDDAGFSNDGPPTEAWCEAQGFPVNFED